MEHQMSTIRGQFADLQAEVLRLQGASEGQIAQAQEKARAEQDEETQRLRDLVGGRAAKATSRWQEFGMLGAAAGAASGAFP